MIARNIVDTDTRSYGCLYQLNQHYKYSRNVNCWTGDDWVDYNTQTPLLEKPCYVGLTSTSPLPCPIKSLERHFHTREALLPMGQAIAFLLAPAGLDTLCLDDLTAVTLYPGQAFLISTGVWHSAAHGLHQTAPYYYLANIYENEPTEWADITGGPVLLEP